MRAWRGGAVLCALALSGWGCGNTGGPPVLLGSDGGPLPDAGSPDGGNPPPPEADPPPLVPPSPPAPPAARVSFYGAAQGILEKPVVGASRDEAGNLWIATQRAVYLQALNATGFRRISSAEGLHLQDNPVEYCDADVPGGDHACPIAGGAYDPGISEIEGGGRNQLFVGYWGNEAGDGDWFDPHRHTGKLDILTFQPDPAQPGTNAGTFQVARVDFVISGHAAQYWLNRSVLRLLYDHSIHPGDLYVGTNHGVDLIRPELYRAPRAGEYFNSVNAKYMADHLHPRVCANDGGPCDPNGSAEESHQRIGGWRGLGLDAVGNLWVAGRWTAGAIRWTATLSDWAARPGRVAFARAFGDPYAYRSYTQAPGFINEPVFRPPEEGASVSLSAVSVAPDGRVWFASSAWSSGDLSYGVAVFDGRSFRVFDPELDLGALEHRIRDLVALPDGRLVLAGSATGLTIYNPQTGAHQTFRASDGAVPDDHIQRVELDLLSGVPVLNVSTYAGAAVLTQWPLP